MSLAGFGRYSAETGMAGFVTHAQGTNKKSMITIRRINISQLQLILLAGLIFVLISIATAPNQFFTPNQTTNVLILIKVLPLTTLLCSLFFWSVRLTRLWISLLLLLSVVVAFFVFKYGVRVSPRLIQDAMITNVGEIESLLSLSLIVFVFAGGVLPVAVVYSITILQEDIRKLLKQWAGLVIACSVLMHLPDLTDHRKIVSEKSWVFAIPLNIALSTGRYISSNKRILPVAERVAIHDKYQFTSFDTRNEKIMVLVITESLRSDFLSINGHDSATTTHLEQEQNIVSFTRAYSCSTSTLVSVPCLLSHFDAPQFSLPEKHTSVISVLKRLGYETHFLSQHGFKGLSNCIEADHCMMRRQIRDQFPDNSEAEYDHILLKLLDNILIQEPTNRFIVLHLMGSHFRYSTRLPPGEESYRKFNPTCDAAIHACENDALLNAYRNTIVYQDEFLHQLFGRLAEKNAMVFFTSDHGESLGEQGVFGHGRPEDGAPEQQLHVPLIIWTSEDPYFKTKVSKKIDKRLLDIAVSHDHIFHSILDCAGIGGELVDRQRSVCSGLTALSPESGG